MTDATAEIDRLLHERRPDRYTPGEDDDWLDEIARDVEHLMPTNARVALARSVVGNREGIMTRATNRILRECKDQPPLDWEFFATLPLVVGDERVAIRACTPQDFRQFANEERRRNAQEFRTRDETCEGAEWLADYMERNHIDNGGGLHW